MVRRPTDALGVMVAVAVVIAIVVNALALQSGPHPAPFVPRQAPSVVSPVAPKFATTGTVDVVPASAPTAPADGRAPAQAAPTQPMPPKRTRAQLLIEIQRELARLGYYEGAPDGKQGPKMEAAIREFEQAAKLRVTGEANEGLLKSLTGSKLKARKASRPAAETTGSVPTKRIVSVQRVLSEFGYGPVPPTGVYNDATKRAIEKFERDRKLPVRGQVSESFVKALSAATGRVIE